MSILKHSTRINRSPIPIRWIVDYVSGIGSDLLLKMVWLDEDGNNGFRYRAYGKIWKFTDFFYSRWGTYYTLDWDAVMKDIDDKSSDGMAYWEGWNEDPLTGDAWRIKEKDGYGLLTEL